jgi:hypothetical protein
VNTPEELLQHIATNYDSHRVVATLSYSVGKKTAALTETEHTLSECRRAVTGTRDIGLYELATSWRKAEEFVTALRDEIRMWILLGEHNFSAAWDTLVAAQSSAEQAARWLPSYGPAQHLTEHLAAVECVVFPKQRFISPSLIVSEADVECSICHKRGGECDHIAGDVYAGDVAHRIIHNIDGVREISFVDNPANKHARAMCCDDVDLLTGEQTTFRAPQFDRT